MVSKIIAALTIATTSCYTINSVKNKLKFSPAVMGKEATLKALFFILFLCICISIVATPAFSQTQRLLLDDFEEGTVNFGSGGDSLVEVTADRDIKYSGEQSLKIVYKAVPATHGYIWVGKGADAGPNAHWLVEPEDIVWEGFNAIAFYMHGSDSKTRIALDIEDSGFERWRFIFEDNFIGWKQIVCPFSEFHVRDWHPTNADKNAILDFPIRDFQIVPLPNGDTKEGTVYFDRVELIRK